MEGAAATARDSTPHVLLHNAELIKFRDERKTLVLTLTNDKVIEGAIRWFDDQAIHIVTTDRSELTVFKHAVLHYSTT